LAGNLGVSKAPFEQSLKCRRPDGPHVIHATIPVPRQSFDPKYCPYSIHDDSPQNKPLVTQWELVATMREFMVCELSAYNENVAPAGFVHYAVSETHTSGPPFHTVSPEVAGYLSKTDVTDAKILVTDQLGAVHEIDLAGEEDHFRLVRGGGGGGFVRFTSRRHVVSPVGGFHIFATWSVGSNQIDFQVKWHNADFEARRAAIYFKSFSVQPGRGWKLSAYEDVVQSGITDERHVIPTQFEREFRFSVFPEDESFRGENEGWAVGDWSQGGYLPTRLPVPDLTKPVFHTDWAARRTADLDRLNRGRQSPQWPSGTLPPDRFWPVVGNPSGNDTSGQDMWNHYHVEVAHDGDPDALLAVQIQAQRNHARHPAGIFLANGDPITPDDLIPSPAPQNGTPWFYPNFVFSSRSGGGPPEDAPFDFHLFEPAPGSPGIGAAPYEAELVRWKPNNEQHFVRTFKDSHTLVWLDNDPLARLDSRMEGVMARMVKWGGPGGELVAGFGGPGDSIAGWGAGKGITDGRDEAFEATAICFQYAIATDPLERTRLGEWLDLYSSSQRSVQMPSGFTQATHASKVNTAAPLGGAYFGASNLEASFIATALQGIRETVERVDADALRRLVVDIGKGQWRYAWWRPGGVPARAPLSNFPVGPLDKLNPSGSLVRYTSQAEWPSSVVAEITSYIEENPFFLDNFQVGAALGYWIFLQSMAVEAATATTAMMGVTLNDFRGAYDALIAEGTSMLHSRALLLVKFQEAFG